MDDKAMFRQVKDPEQERTGSGMAYASLVLADRVNKILHESSHVNPCVHPSCPNQVVWRVTVEVRWHDETIWCCEQHLEEVRKEYGTRFLGAVKVGSLLEDSFR